MRTIKNTIICDVKFEKTSGEVDFDLKVDILGEKNVDESYSGDIDNMIHIIDKGLDVDKYPIKIETLRKILDNFEKDGCNYISIDYNCDHTDYTFYGSDVHTLTEIEICEIIENNKQKKLDEINLAIGKYDNETKKLLALADKIKNNN